jgi:bifunctional UDP-N-acetylglucosamine pyrophosphorylase/glucosamine-1-phosphate N-acetyltransferase
MKSRRAKVLMPVAGRPLLGHVLATARELDPVAIHVVYGHGGEQVREAFAADTDLQWVLQAERLGTGHAVAQALAQVPDEARVLVLYGDVPLTRAETLRPLVTADGLALLTTRLADPFGYGRVLCDDAARVMAVVEEKDASAEERAVDLVNTGIVAADAARLRGWIARLGRDNAQGEYYLTDIFAMAAAEQRPARSVECADPVEAAGANNPLQLAELEAQYRRRRAAELMLAGVRLADPVRIDVRGRVRAGSDVEIDVDVILEGDVELGDDVRIGPFTRVHNARLASGTVVLAHCDLDGVVTHGPCTIGPFARLRPGAELAPGVHVGNFVEIKKAKLGDGSKANHRCRHDHLQLRRREQAPHADRRRCLHRLQQRAGRARQRRRPRHHRRRFGDHQGCPARRAHRGARPPAHPVGLAAPDPAAEIATGRPGYAAQA